MVWTINYQAEVEFDLQTIGRAEARAILKGIDVRIIHGEPDKSGKPLTGQLLFFANLIASRDIVIKFLHRRFAGIMCRIRFGNIRGVF